MPQQSKGHGLSFSASGPITSACFTSEEGPAVTPLVTNAQAGRGPAPGGGTPWGRDPAAPFGPPEAGRPTLSSWGQEQKRAAAQAQGRGRPGDVKVPDTRPDPSDPRAVQASQAPAPRLAGAELAAGGVDIVVTHAQAGPAVRADPQLAQGPESPPADGIACLSERGTEGEAHQALRERGGDKKHDLIRIIVSGQGAGHAGTRGAAQAEHAQHSKARAQQGSQGAGAGRPLFSTSPVFGHGGGRAPPFSAPRDRPAAPSQPARFGHDGAPHPPRDSRRPEGPDSRPPQGRQSAQAAQYSQYSQFGQGAGRRRNMDPDRGGDGAYASGPAAPRSYGFPQQRKQARGAFQGGHQQGRQGRQGAGAQGGRKDRPPKHSQAETRNSPEEMLTRQVRSYQLIEAVSQRTDFILGLILPNPRSEQYRLRALSYVSQIITEAAPQLVVVPYGSFVSKTYLPDSDLDLCCYSAYCSQLETLNLVKGALENKAREYREYQERLEQQVRQADLQGAAGVAEGAAPANPAAPAGSGGSAGPVSPGEHEQSCLSDVPGGAGSPGDPDGPDGPRNPDNSGSSDNPDALATAEPPGACGPPPLFPIEDLSVVVAEVSIIKFICGGIGFDISFSQPGGLVTALFIECLDRAVGKDHLLKKSLILAQAWCLYEARILGSHNMMLNSYSMRTMMIHIILNCPQIFTPLQALLTFLGYYSCFQWDISVLSLAGPVPFEALASLDALPFASELRQAGKPAAAVAATASAPATAVAGAAGVSGTMTSPAPSATASSTAPAASAASTASAASAVSATPAPAPPAPPAETRDSKAPSESKDAGDAKDAKDAQDSRNAKNAPAQPVGQASRPSGSNDPGEAPADLPSHQSHHSQSQPSQQLPPQFPRPSPYQRPAAPLSALPQAGSQTAAPALSPYPRPDLDLCGPLFWYISKPFYIKLTLMRLLNDTGFSQPKGIEKLFGRIGAEHWAVQPPPDVPERPSRRFAGLNLSAECAAIVSAVQRNARGILGHLKRLRLPAQPSAEAGQQNSQASVGWPRRRSSREGREALGGFVTASESEQSGESEGEKGQHLSHSASPQVPTAALGRAPPSAEAASAQGGSPDSPGLSAACSGAPRGPGPEAREACLAASMDDVLLAAVLQLIRSSDFIFLNSERLSFFYKENKLNIMDPLQLSNNIGRSVSSYSARRIRRSLQVGFNQLSILIGGLMSGDTTVAMALADLDTFFANTLSMYEPGYDRCDHAMGRVVSDALPDCLASAAERRSRSHLLPTTTRREATGPFSMPGPGIYSHGFPRSASGPAQAGSQAVVPPDAPMLVPSPLLALQNQSDPLLPSEKYFDLDEDALAGNIEGLYSGCELICAAVLGCRKVQGALFGVAANFR